ncbi:MAG: SRPBCC domain-containing protein, partial [Nitrososphaerales archaeon]
MTFERQYPHPIEDVWRAITEPNELASWFLTEAKIQGGTGGT